MASVVDVHPRESIAGVHSTICFRLFLSSVHEVSAVSAIFSLHTGLVLRSPPFSRCVSVFAPHVHSVRLTVESWRLT